MVLNAFYQTFKCASNWVINAVDNLKAFGRFSGKVNVDNLIMILPLSQLHI